MVDVDFFNACLGRLKVAIGASKDKEVAEALGLEEKAFNARKRRGSFPEKELYTLAAKRPELGIDTDYVLTGITAAALGLLDAGRARVERAIKAGVDFKTVNELTNEQRPGLTPSRLKQFNDMLPKLRATEFEAVFQMVQSIVSLRDALEKMAASQAKSRKKAA
ncbi:MAG: helix-turn-helix domain containing protein [Gallionellaceae bacterium]|nr:helix-turn-helix domain containing protein [Gallionellaceae bacterium]